MPALQVLGSGLAVGQGVVALCGKLLGAGQMGVGEVANAALSLEEYAPGLPRGCLGVQ